MAHNVVETNTVRRSHEVGHAFINQYELLSNLGEGMHGKVVLARISATKHHVAIKVMKRVDPHNRRLPKSNRLGVPPLTAQQETETKIRREIAVMKKCSHQNLVQLLEVIDDPASKKIYLVMENLAGGEVKWRNRFEQPVLELGQVKRILRDVTLGLEYLHHQGIIHRDIKPANLLWTAERQSVKICDFGVSQVTAAAAHQDPSLYDEAGLTKTAGSPAFFAPEICYMPTWSSDDSFASSRLPLPPLPPITKQIDIWALGVTFYCLLFGRPPWQGQTEYAMFRAICDDNFTVPDTMAVECIPTGGLDHRPEGKDIGWCVVELLKRLLEKDQNRRIKLADIKCLTWIQDGVTEPERWLRETAVDTQTLVTVTDEDTQHAIKSARFSYAPRWVTRLASRVKRVPLPLISRSRPGSKNTGTIDTYSGPTSSKSATQTASLGRTRSPRPRSVMDRPVRRFMFTNVSPTRSNTVPGVKMHRRNASTGRTPQHAQVFSDPSIQPDRVRNVNSGPLRSTTICPSGLKSPAWPVRRLSGSLHPPLTSIGTDRRFLGAAQSPVSPVPSPTTPDEAQFAGSGLKARLSQVIRKNSVKVMSKARGAGCSGRADDGPTRRGRTSAETLDVLRASEDLGFTSDRRVSSWQYGATPDPVDDDDGQVSVELTGSEAGAGCMQDFNKSVVRFGAGGYVDRDTASGGLAAGPRIAPDAIGSGTLSLEVTHHGDSSSNSTATAGTPHQHVDASHYPPRVTSPLAHTSPAFGSDEDEDDQCSDVFRENALPDANSSDDEMLEVRTRRPSTVLNRSANTSPLR